MLPKVERIAEKNEAPASPAPAAVDGEPKSVPVRVVQGLALLMERLGVGREAFFAGTDTTPEVLEDREGRVTQAAGWHLVERALDLSRDPALGLHWSERLGPGTFGAVPLLSLHAPTMGDSLRTLLQFVRLLGGERRLALVEQGDEASMRMLSSPAEPPRVQRFGAELGMSGFYRFLRSYGANVLPKHVCFEHCAPTYRAEYTRIFGGLERFQQPFTEITFDRAFLSLPSPNRDEGVHEALKALAEKRLKDMPGRTSYAQQVAELLVKKGWPYRTDMTTVARWLGLSVRTLRRRLSEEDKRYEDILSDALGRVAKQFVGEQDRTIDDVAQKMGFSSPAAFYRAFKRWTGMTPRSYRAMLFGDR